MSERPNTPRSEILALIHRVNLGSQRDVAIIVDDASYPFSVAASIVPTDRQGIQWERAVFSSGPISCEKEESAHETTRRIIADFHFAAARGGVPNSALMLVGSDDYFDAGILCEAAVVPEILAEWLRFPQGIEIVDERATFCFLITFARSVFVFSRSWDDAALPIDTTSELPARR